MKNPRLSRVEATRRRIHKFDYLVEECRVAEQIRKITAHQDLCSGLIRLHILHHASVGEAFRLWMMEELGRHGYKLSAGTM